MNALTTSQQSIHPETLLPTESASQSHCLCLYLQVQIWMQLSSSETLKAEQWGWKLEKEHLETYHD